MSHMVMCRVCHERFDCEKEEFVMPSKNFYYHKKCYESWRASDLNNAEDEAWIDRIYDFIAHDLKQSYDWHKCEVQRERFTKQNGFTNKGIYFTLKYFYEIKGGDWKKGYEGIGIVPYIYKEATEYWVNRERRENGIMKAIEEQIKNRVRDDDRQKKFVSKTRKKRREINDFEEL